MDNSKIRVRVKKQDIKENQVKRETFEPEAQQVEREVFMPPESIGEVVREVIVPEIVYTPPQADEKEANSFSPEENSFEQENETGEKKRKNIIFYFTDQQRYDTFNEEVMPNLSALALEGVIFENCFTCQPVCGPARACLQTGVYATGIGCFRNGISLPRDAATLADYFNEAGYDTAYIGKWHLASDKDYKGEKEPVPKERQGGYNYWRASDVLEMTSHGYDGYVYDGEGNRIDFVGYRADRINDFALEYIEERDREKPFFMFVSQLEPHHQNDRRKFEGYAQTVEEFGDYPIPEELTLFRGNYSKHYPDYISAINRVDHNLGRLIDKLKQEGIYEDTVIVFTSDHGCHFKTRNAEYKRSCHDSSIHVPLVIKGGAFTGGVSDERLVSLIDLPSTLLALADIEVPEYFKGRSLIDGKERNAVYIQISETQCSRAVRTHDYTYCVGVSGYGAGMTLADSPVYTEEYLYDNLTDPLQENNLIKDNNYKIVRSTMKKLLLTEMQEAEGKKAVILPCLVPKKK